MSRIGRMPVVIPAGVTVTIGEENLVTVKGPRGTLTEKFDPRMKLEIADGHLHVSRPTDEKEDRSLHGLTRALIHNMVVGVTEGFQKTLEINGTGYRATMQGKNLLLYVGHSLVNGMPQAALTVAEPEGITDHHRCKGRRQAARRSDRCGHPRQETPRALSRQGHPLCR